MPETGLEKKIRQKRPENVVRKIGGGRGPEGKSRDRRKCRERMDERQRIMAENHIH